MRAKQVSGHGVLPQPAIKGRSGRRGWYTTVLIVAASFSGGSLFAVHFPTFESSPGPTIAHSQRFPGNEGSEAGEDRRMPPKPSLSGFEQVERAFDSSMKAEPVKPVNTTQLIQSIEPAKSVHAVEPVEPVEHASVSSDHPVNWKGAGGKFGLQADWRLAVQKRGKNGEQSMRGETCLTVEGQMEVKEILQKRRTAPAKKVAACIRTKDFARFLPEWIAFHYAIGVDEVSVYDDFSSTNTSEVLQPFIKAGIVRYNTYRIKRQKNEFEPLNLCLAHYMERRKNDTQAPTWILFHDEDEYLYPVDTNLTILQALTQHEDTCCVKIPRIQYGSSGHYETPPGLVVETFLMHKTIPPSRQHANPKVMVNLEPTHPEEGKLEPPLRSAHNAFGCTCHEVSDTYSAMRINHYLGSKGDFFDRTSLYWEEYNTGKHSPEVKFAQRDHNEGRSDSSAHWACATREILFRILRGLDLEPRITEVD